MSKTALVFGASGISGRNLVKELLVYPTATTFKSVIGLTNRPWTRKVAVLPEDDRLALYSGVDLTSTNIDAVIASAKAAIPNIADVTHAYLFAYVHEPKVGTVVEVNTRIVDNSIRILKALSPKLEHVIIQTGAKAYGLGLFHLMAPYPAPWVETQPRVPQPAYDHVFYYPQIDTLTRHAEGTSWKWTEIRPAAVIGFAPGGSAMNMARLFAIYLSMYREKYGVGAVCPFPGTAGAWVTKDADSPVTHNAHMEIWSSLQGEKTNKLAINCVDDAQTYSERWPKIVASYGLKSAPPTNPEGINVEQWVKDNRELWTALEKRHNLKRGWLEETDWEFIGVLTLPFDRELGNARMKELGFTASYDSIKEYQEVWDEMAKAGTIPNFRPTNKIIQSRL